jgi:hypothetical protein
VSLRKVNSLSLLVLPDFNRAADVSAALHDAGSGLSFLTLTFLTAFAPLALASVVYFAVPLFT